MQYGPCARFAQDAYHRGNRCAFPCRSAMATGRFPEDLASPYGSSMVMVPLASLALEQHSSIRSVLSLADRT